MCDKTAIILDFLQVLPFDVTARDAYRWFYGNDEPQADELEDIRRRLEHLVQAGTVTRHDPRAGQPVVYRAVDRRQ